MAEFWDNSPNQTRFISLCAEVNKLNTYINDPNVAEAQVQIFQVQFIAAKAKMALLFLIVNSEWEEWLGENDFETPVLHKNGVITVASESGQGDTLTLKVSSPEQDTDGMIYYWDDFYRMLALRAFLLRSEPGDVGEKYHPESYFNENLPEAT